MSVAYQAWDLAAASEGRFVLGLGAQVKAHITRRFSMHWDNPVAQMREYLEALHAIFAAFQHDVPLDHRGRYCAHSLLTPAFNPGPLPDGHAPQIALAAVGAAMTRGRRRAVLGGLPAPLHDHPVHRHRHLPALVEGRDRAVSEKPLPWRLGHLMLAIGDNAEEQAAATERVRKQPAFYGSTPAYVEVLRSIGYENLQPELLTLSKHGRWDDMSALFDDDLMERFAFRGTLEELPQKIAHRYAGRVDRVASYFPLPDYPEERISAFLSAARAAAERPVAVIPSWSRTTFCASPTPSSCSAIGTPNVS
ncbi:hypothetical protein GCM10023350_03240 [Nocardioides endophyticus]|uniref:Luciferase-like domain-containing protein n=2 Tax=Nocardioides endophyticus TaxID=1353775 RepID=A0ABP8YDP2_9ACTN